MKQETLRNLCSIFRFLGRCIPPFLSHHPTYYGRASTGKRLGVSDIDTLKGPVVHETSTLNHFLELYPPNKTTQVV